MTLIHVHKNREKNRKSVYSKVEFINMVPAAIRKQIKAEEVAGNADIADWVFIVTMMDKVDLNDLPSGFISGLYAMADNPNISINKAAVDGFLERKISIDNDVID